MQILYVLINTHTCTMPARSVCSMAIHKSTRTHKKRVHTRRICTHIKAHTQKNAHTRRIRTHTQTRTPKRSTHKKLAYTKSLKHKKRAYTKRHTHENAYKKAPHKKAPHTKAQTQKRKHKRRSYEKAHTHSKLTFFREFKSIVKLYRFAPLGVELYTIYVEK